MLFSISSPRTGPTPRAPTGHAPWSSTKGGLQEAWCVLTTRPACVAPPLRLVAMVVRWLPPPALPIVRCTARCYNGCRCESRFFIELDFMNVVILQIAAQSFFACLLLSPQEAIGLRALHSLLLQKCFQVIAFSASNVPEVL